MAVKSIVQIDVEDGPFKRFQELFERYQKQLKETPDAWRRTGAEAVAAIGGLLAGVETAQGQAQRHRQAASHTQETAGRAAKTQATAWHDMARDAGKFAAQIGSATRELLKWASLTGLISGVLGGGGLFGIDRLAIQAGTQRRSALGLGVTPGEESAFRLNYGRIVNPDAFLTHINEALTDPRKSIGLYGAGISSQEIAGGNTAQVAIDAISGVKKLVDQTPDRLLGTLLSSHRLGELGLDVHDLQQIKSTPADELADYQKRFRSDQQTLNLTRQQQKAWQDLEVQLKRAGEMIENAFIKSLTPLAPQLEKLSSAFADLVTTFLQSPQVKEWIDDLAAGLKAFAGYISTPEFKAEVEAFTTAVGDLAKATVGAVKYLASFFEHDTSGPGGTATPAPGETPPAIGGWGHGPNGWGWYKGTEDDKPAGGAAAPEPLHWPHALAPWDWKWGGGATDDHGVPSGASPSSFRQEEQRNALPPGLLSAVSYVESGNNPFAVSSAGAKGQFQFMDATARQYGVTNPFDPNQSAHGAALYYHDLLTKYGSIDKAAAAYNEGPGNLDRTIRQYGDDWRSHIPTETARYVQKILAGVQQPGLGKDRAPSVTINVNNNTGGNATVSASQLAI